MDMAKQLYNDLKRYGLDVWLDTESLLPGDRWKEKIEDAIKIDNYCIIKNLCSFYSKRIMGIAFEIWG